MRRDAAATPPRRRRDAAVTPTQRRHDADTRPPRRRRDAAAVQKRVRGLVATRRYQLQRPVEPFLVKSLSEGADAATVAATYGRLQSFFHLAQTVGSPIVGALLDRWGPRRCSVLVFGCCAASYERPRRNLCEKSYVGRLHGMSTSWPRRRRDPY